MALLSQLCIDMDKYIEFHRNLRALSIEIKDSASCHLIVLNIFARLSEKYTPKLNSRTFFPAEF